MTSDSNDFNLSRIADSRVSDGVHRACIATIVPAHIARLGRLLGRCVYVLDGPHRRIVRRNLEFAHPRWSREKITRISRGVFQNLGTTFLEICQLATMSRQDLLSRVEVEGAEHLEAALERKKGVIVVGAHLGNWEMGLQCVCCLLQQPILGVAKKIRLESLNRQVHRIRTRFGIKVIYKKGALPEMRGILRQGGVLALLVDQSRRSEGVEVTFFGQRVTATPAVAFLSLRCQSPVLPMFCIRQPDGRLFLEVKAPLEMKRTGDLRADVQTNTQLITDVVEQAVRRYPDQWLWAHKRWKKYYPHLYPEYLERRKRRHARKGR